MPSWSMSGQSRRPFARAGFQVAPDAFDYAFYTFWVAEDSVSPWFPVGLDFLE